MIFGVAFGGGLKCPHKIHLNTQQCPKPHFLEKRRCHLWMVPQFKTSSAQSLATRARAIPELEATAHIYLQPASAEKLPHLKAEGMYCTKGQLISKCLLGVSNSPKNLKTQIFALAYWGRNFSFVFGRIEKPKCHFEINWPKLLPTVI